MKKIYKNLCRYDLYAGYFLFISTYNKRKVLEKFKVSENDYDNTIKFYNDDPEKWQPFLIV